MTTITATAASAAIGRGEQMATRAIFLFMGLALSAWAPLVPYAKARLGIDDAEVGILLLCLGAGSVITMPLTGALIGRFGCRLPIMIAGGVMCLMLPLLAIVETPILLGLTLFVLGAATGTVDVASNAQAVIVEQAARRPMMSGFHALFSVGGIAGAGAIIVLLRLGASPVAAITAMAVVVAILLLVARPHFLPYANHGAERTPLFVLPRGMVVLLGFLCFVVFLAEGAMLDWSALFLTQLRDVAPEEAGIGYAAFAVAMSLGRLTGDRIVHMLGGFRVLLFGSLLMIAGFLLAITVPSLAGALGGFVLIGLGASNIVPILFTAAGRQHRMPLSLAVAAITTLAYSGILLGPALVGFVAHATNLAIAFGAVAALQLLVTASARIVTR
jgi:predicted MFS family arabinose efflux permease